MSNEELKPCPFCGSEAEIISGRLKQYQIRCSNRTCITRDGVCYTKEDYAITEWNTRTPQEGEEGSE